jgi:hypothetical protein
MDASELARWTRFAAKGGIGRCTALADCVAESEEELMFLKVSASGVWVGVFFGAGVRVWVWVWVRVVWMWCGVVWCGVVWCGVGVGLGVGGCG